MLTVEMFNGPQTAKSRHHIKHFTHNVLRAMFHGIVPAFFLVLPVPPISHCGENKTQMTLQRMLTHIQAFSLSTMVNGAGHDPVGQVIRE